MTASSPSAPLPTRDEFLERSRQWADTLLSGAVTWFPVRHHSPACAWHLQQWIQQHQPRSVVVEGPSSFNRWIDHLVDPDCVPPVAVLTATNEKNGSRESAFYPFCRYSPEWVAIASGREVGAKVQFADLEFTEKRSRAATPKEQPKPTSFGVLLSDDRYFHSSDFIANLVRRLGCRDFDEAWERLFETNDLSIEELVGRLATYCDCIRTGTPTDELIADQTLAREAEMLEVVRSEFRRLKKPKKQASIVVVTGGMHTIALCEAFEQKGNPHRLSERQSAPESWLIRYSYDQ
ncbi:MAG: DUF5682 family protein, partial [Cyanobacteria bacterium J06648_11]